MKELRQQNNAIAYDTCIYRIQVPCFLTNMEHDIDIYVKL